MSCGCNRKRSFSATTLTIAILTFGFGMLLGSCSSCEVEPQVTYSIPEQSREKAGALYVSIVGKNNGSSFAHARAQEAVNQIYGVKEVTVPPKKR